MRGKNGKILKIRGKTGNFGTFAATPLPAVREKVAVECIPGFGRKSNRPAKPDGRAEPRGNPAKIANNPAFLEAEKMGNLCKRSFCPPAQRSLRRFATKLGVSQI
jgi:hypothetical protein